MQGGRGQGVREGRQGEVGSQGQRGGMEAGCQGHGGRQAGREAGSQVHREGSRDTRTGGREEWSILLIN